MSRFPFIHHKALQHNLDVVFEHIIDLLTLSESESYKGKDALVSSLRKTIIVHTASIIEALLLWKLKNTCASKNIELTDEWKYFNICTVYVIDNSQEVITGFRKKEQKNIDRLDFIRVTDLCYKYKILKSGKLKKDIHEVRELRNRLHIGGLLEIEKEYTRADLEFCFSVAKKVKEAVSKSALNKLKTK